MRGHVGILAVQCITGGNHNTAAALGGAPTNAFLVGRHVMQQLWCSRAHHCS